MFYTAMNSLIIMGALLAVASADPGIFEPLFPAPTIIKSFSAPIIAAPPIIKAPIIAPAPIYFPPPLPIIKAVSVPIISPPPIIKTIALPAPIIKTVISSPPIFSSPFHGYHHG